MAYGQGMVKSDAINQHRRLAGADRKDAFWADKFPPNSGRGSDKKESYGVSAYPPEGQPSGMKGDGYRREAKS